MSMKRADITKETSALLQRKEQLEALIALRKQVADLEVEYINDFSPEATLKAIVSEVCLEFNVLPYAVRSRNRTTNVAEPRNLVYWLGRRFGLVCTFIGKELRRNHGTVLNGEQAVENRIETEPAYRTRAMRLLARCEQRIGKIE